MNIIKILASKIPNHCRLQFDDGTEMRFSLDIVMKYYLRKGSEISDELLETMKLDQDFLTAKQIAYRFATAKPRTIKQIKQKLKEKQINPINVPKILEFLEEFNLVDDFKFCKIYIGNLEKRKPQSKIKALMELISKGVEKNIAKSAIDEFYPDEQTLDFAKKIADKKLRIMTHKPLEKQKSSVIQSLQREGFPINIIKEINNIYFANK